MKASTGHVAVEKRAMKAFDASRVWVDESGDYYQVMFEQGLDGSDQYLLIQRSFEMPDDGRCYVEDKAMAMTGHYRVRKAELGRGQFSTELAGSHANSVEVAFDIPEADFVELARVVEIMLPHVLPVGDVADIIRRQGHRE